MMKRIYAVDRVIERIENLDSRSQTEYYSLLYNMIITHFLAYRLTSTGFFTEKVR